MNILKTAGVTTLILCCALLFPSTSLARSIFSGTPFEKLADVVGNATGTNDLQKKLGLPNAGGDIANFFERAKKDSGPLVTAITTLGCPGCVVAAAVVSGPGAAMDAVFTTGMVTSAFATSPLLGIATIVILGADEKTGETGYRQVVVAAQDTVKPSPKTFTLNADCIIREKTRNTFFVAFKDLPPNVGAIEQGDTLILSAPQCSAFSDPTNEAVTTATIKKTGASELGMAKGRFNYVIVGTPL